MSGHNPEMSVREKAKALIFILGPSLGSILISELTKVDLRLIISLVGVLTCAWAAGRPANHWVWGVHRAKKS